MTSARIRLVEAIRTVRARHTVSRAFARPHPVLVVTAPKTGSTSLEHALGAAGIPPVKLHTPLRPVDRYREGWHGVGQPAPMHAFLSEAVLRRQSAGPHGRLRVMTLVRDPVARAVSAAFQRVATGREMATDVDAMRAIALRLVRKHAIEGGTAQWFAEEFSPWIGADILDLPFDRAAGFARVPGAAGDVLFMQTEKLDACAEVVSDFVGEPLSLGRSNVRAETPLARHYDQIRSGLRFPPDVIDLIYDQPLFRHVYDERDIGAFRRRWTATDA